MRLNRDFLLIFSFFHVNTTKKFQKKPKYEEKIAFLLRIQYHNSTVKMFYCHIFNGIISISYTRTFRIFHETFFCVCVQTNLNLSAVTAGEEIKKDKWFKNYCMANFIGSFFLRTFYVFRCFAVAASEKV